MGRLTWTHVIRQTALFVFVLQFARWFQHYWLSETAQLVFTVLAIVYVIELLLPKLQIWLRLIFQLVAIGTAHLIILEWHADMLSQESMEAAGAENMILFIDQFLPYIWFALAAWLIYIVLDLWLLTREQVFFATVIAVVALAIADSYTIVYLWDETALVVISGLILMISRHFAEFKEKHPHTWRHIADYPWGITMTAGTLVAFIGLMSIISPNVRPLLVDPYTAWNQLQGKSVNFSVKEDTQTAIASFRLNLLTSSGYGRDDSQLGGGFNYNFDPVFEVTTKVRSYWRGESKSVYTGSGWVNPDVEPLMNTFEIGETIAGEVEIDETVPVNTFKQHFVFRDDDPPKLFGAYPIIRVDAMNGKTEDAGIIEKDMRTGALEHISEGSIYSYTVTSAVPVVNEQLLQQAPPVVFDDEFAAYLQLPDTLPERVYALAEEITAEAETPYEKVKAIETYLRTNYSYTNTPDESKGSSADFVDRFLFEIQEGYCDFFSTAMAVLVRTTGIPARWVKGYTTGIMDDETAIMYEQQYAFSGGVIPDIEMTYIVRNADAHSWVEVYFEGYGWVMFEPTAGFHAPVISAPSDAQSELVDSETTVEETEEITVAAASTGKRIIPYIVTIAALLILALIAWWLVRRFGSRQLSKLRRFMTRLGLMKEPMNPNEQIVMEFNRLLHYLHRKGLVREEHQTVREAAALWGERLPMIEDQLRQALHDFELAKYSRRKFSDQDAAKYQQQLRELRQRMKRSA